MSLVLDFFFRILNIMWWYLFWGKKCGFRIVRFFKLEFMDKEVGGIFLMCKVLEYIVSILEKF